MHYKDKRGERRASAGPEIRELRVLSEEPAMIVFSKLAGERAYLIDAVLKGKARPTYHEWDTSSCEEKAEVAGIERESVLKVVLFEHQSKIYCVALPDEGEIDQKEFFAKLLGISKSEAKRIRIARELPSGMSFGTCTPFFSHQTIIEIEKLILADIEPKRTVDVSIGGSNTESRKCSLQMRYGDVVEMLKEEFGEKVVVCDVPVK